MPFQKDTTIFLPFLNFYTKCNPHLEYSYFYIPMHKTRHLRTLSKEPYHITYR